MEAYWRQKNPHDDLYKGTSLRIDIVCLQLSSICMYLIILGKKCFLHRVVSLPSRVSLAAKQNYISR